MNIKTDSGGKTVTIVVVVVVVAAGTGGEGGQDRDVGRLA